MRRFPRSGRSCAGGSGSWGRGTFSPFCRSSGPTTGLRIRLSTGAPFWTSWRPWPGTFWRPGTAFPWSSWPSAARTCWRRGSPQAGRSARRWRSYWKGCWPGTAPTKRRRCSAGCRSTGPCSPRSTRGSRSSGSGRPAGRTFRRWRTCGSASAAGRSGPWSIPAAGAAGFIPSGRRPRPPFPPGPSGCWRTAASRREQ